MTTTSRPTSDGASDPRQSRTGYLRATALLDIDDPTIRSLVERRGWSRLDRLSRIGAIYDFVRDEIEFGYNADDDIPASRVLSDGYGQCNTKATLLMALLRAAGVPCRFHGATIHKRLQRGVVPALFYRLAPDEILHSWVEVDLNGEWKRLEGVILDIEYLDGLRAEFPDERGPFLGYGVGTEDLADPPIDWNGGDTEIQMSGLSQDLGLYDDPDAFYRSVGTNLSGPRATLYRWFIRRLMNRTVSATRNRS